MLYIKLKLCMAHSGKETVYMRVCLTWKFYVTYGEGTSRQGKTVIVTMQTPRTMMVNKRVAFRC